MGQTSTAGGLSAVRLNAYGRDLEIRREDAHWCVYYLGNEGKRRRAEDIRVPDSVSEQDLPVYIADLLHEYASARYPEVVVLGQPDPL